jgi:hypothetical protein
MSDPALSPAPADSIDEAVARMQALASALAPDDGLAAFNRLYLGVTEAVRDAVAAGRFVDARFIPRLDVDFANLYFAAVAAWQDDRGAVPRAWAPVFERRGDRRVASLQFALAGMNAHINRDLMVALVTTAKALGGAIDGDPTWRGDYLAINEILTRVEADEKATLLTGVVAVADRMLDGSDDRVAMWSLVEARDAAWKHALALWALDGQPELRDDLVDAIDGLTGLAGRGLLAAMP